MLNFLEAIEDAGPAPAASVADRVTAADVIEFIETMLFIPEGPHVGKKFKLHEWQKDLIRPIYNNPHGTRRAIISMGRKNAKTTLCACLLLAHLCGPPARNKPKSQLYSAAQSRDQAAIVFSLAVKMVRLNPDLARIVKIRESSKELTCPQLGTRYRALSAEATTAYGLNPSLTIFDELGQNRGPRSALFESLETATGSQENPLTIIISTQAPNDNDLLSVLIDDAQVGHDPNSRFILRRSSLIRLLKRRSRLQIQLTGLFLIQGKFSPWPTQRGACRRARTSTAIWCSISASMLRTRSSPPRFGTRAAVRRRRSRGSRFMAGSTSAPLAT
jgi:hypothetical protein